VCSRCAVGMICIRSVTEASWCQPLHDFVFCVHILFISRYQFTYFVTSSDYVIIFVVCIESGEDNLVLKLNSNLRNSFRVGGV